MLLLCLCYSGKAQQYLILERSGSPKTERLKMYDEITFQLEDGTGQWHTRQILGLNTDAQLIQVGETWLPLTDLIKIKLQRQRAWANIIGGALQGGGASMILGDAWNTLRGHHRISDGGMEFGVVNIGVGTGIRALFSHIKHNLGGHYRLRIIDVTF